MCIFLKKVILFVLILTLFSCNMEYENKIKDEKLSNVNFNINKKTEIIIKND